MKSYKLVVTNFLYTYPLRPEIKGRYCQFKFKIDFMIFFGNDMIFFTVYMTIFKRLSLINFNPNFFRNRGSNLHRNQTNSILTRSFQDFIPSRNLPRRNGTEKDCQSIDKTFKSLGFKVHRYDDLTGQIKTELFMKPLSLSL